MPHQQPTNKNSERSAAKQEALTIGDYPGFIPGLLHPAGVVRLWGKNAQTKGSVA